MLLAKNFDWSIDDGMIVVNKRNVHKTAFTTHEKKLNWISRYGSITFNQFGIEFPLGGMNEAGLVIEELNSWGQTPAVGSNYTLNEFQWVQYCLDNFSSVEELIMQQDSIVIVPLFINLHYLIADSQGKVAVIEFYEGQKYIYSGDDLPYPILSNNYYQNSVEYLGNFNGFGGVQLIPRENTSNERFVRVAAMLQSENMIKDPTDVFPILDTVSQVDTQWSIVYDIRNQKIFFKTRHNFKEIHLEHFDFSSKYPPWWGYVEDAALPSQEEGSFNPSENTEFLMEVYRKYKLHEPEDILEFTFIEMAEYGNSIHEKH